MKTTEMPTMCFDESGWEVQATLCNGLRVTLCERGLFVQRDVAHEWWPAEALAPALVVDLLQRCCSQTDRGDERTFVLIDQRPFARMIGGGR